jgi:flagellar FliL protein
VATKPDAAKSDADGGAKGAPKSKKMLIIVGGLVVVLALAGGVAWFVLAKKAAAAAAADEDVEEVSQVAPKGPPTFLPLDSMVINLADPGGDKVAQIGITLEVVDVKAVEKVKVYLPAIRSGILLLISQRTAVDLLQIEGKEKLAEDVLAEALRPFGVGEDVDPKDKKAVARAKKLAQEAPVRAVYFSSFIVQ